jgi:hypothetical protein
MTKMLVVLGLADDLLNDFELLETSLSGMNVAK